MGTRFLAGAARVWAEGNHSRRPAQPPRSPRHSAPAWPRFAKSGEFEEGRTSQFSLHPPHPSLAAGLPQSPRRPSASGAPLSGAAAGWGGLAPKLTRPARPPRRLLPALGAVLSGPERRRAQPQLPPPRPPWHWKGALGPCGSGVPPRPRTGSSGGLVHPAAPGRPRGRGRARALG